MKKLIVKLVFIFLLIFNFFVFSGDSSVSNSEPNFNTIIKDIKGKAVYDPNSLGISNKHALTGNILSVFFPQSSSNGGALWRVIRIIAVGIGILFLIRGGALFILNADNEGELKKAKLNLIYMFYGLFLFFGATLILGDWLFIGNTGGVEGTLEKVENSIFFNILAFLKAFAYFVAIVMIIYYGLQIIRAYEKEDKIKAAKTGVLNVIIALVFIRVLDFLYYIAQRSSFKDQMIELLKRFTKLGLYIVGFMTVIMVFYGGFLLLTSRGEEEKWKKAKNIIVNIFLVIVIIFLFLLIINQLVKAI